MYGVRRSTAELQLYASASTCTVGHHLVALCDGLLPLAMSAIQSTPEDPLQQAAQAYAFRQLVAHLQARTDVQNIEMMILSGFCRNVSATRI